jgi:hypothetical protein
MSICTRGDTNNSLAQGFVGSVVLVGRQGCHDRAGGAILTERWGHGALVQEGPPLVHHASVLSVCMWHKLLVFSHFCLYLF